MTVSAGRAQGLLIGLWALLAAFAVGPALAQEGLSLQELATGGARKVVDDSGFLGWFSEFLSYVTSSFLIDGAILAVEITAWP